MAFRTLSLWLVASALALASCGGGQGQGVCGDGILEGQEECDDGNTSPGDGCDGNCRSEGGPGCGNGTLDDGEGCDDGNLNSGDGCSAGCSPEFCGDGIVQAGLGEECDDGNLVPGDSCMPICENPPVEDTFLFSEVEFVFDLARYCDQMVTRHAVVHALDLQDGGLRWRCGDVTGISPNQYGQEYCEYVALVNGQQVSIMSAVGDNDQLVCMFTSVFNDSQAVQAGLAAALAQPENLGTPLSNASLVRMQNSFNSKGAADALINDCSGLNDRLEEIRQVACYQAFKEALDAGDVARANQLEALCRVPGPILTGSSAAEERFQTVQQLGARVLTEGEAGFQTQREIIGCVATERGGGVFFRNSDTNICGRTFRAGLECGCDFGFLPDNGPAPGTPGALDGFLFSTWFTPENDRNPPECRLAKVNGRDYPHLMLCEVPAQEIPEIRAHPVYSTDLKGFCNDRFGKNLGILAPLSNIRIPGSCSTNTEFCEDFVN